LRVVRASSTSALSLEPGQRQAARRWIGTALLAITGVMVFVLNTRDFFDLPDTQYAGLPPWSVLAGSAQAIWMVAALLALPIRARAAVRPMALIGASRAARVES